MKHKGTMDLTQGRPIQRILLFSMPLVLGTLFQQLYSFVDTVMVGHLVGDAALAVKCLGFFGICIANPAAWLLATLYCSGMVMYYLRKRYEEAWDV